MVDVFGFTIVMPLLPAIAKDLGASDIMYGLIISSNAIAVLIFGPIWGKLSDKYGRKPILMISQAGNKGITIVNPNTSTIMLRISVNIAREGFIWYCSKYALCSSSLGKRRVFIILS
jgi:MFS family permease